MKYKIIMLVVRAGSFVIASARQILRIWPFGKTSLRERWQGFQYFKRSIMPKEYATKVVESKFSPFYMGYGFKVLMAYSDCYSEWNGIKSDRYISTDLYYNYVIPALNRYDFFSALLDKAFYPTLFGGVRQARTIVCRRNGVFYDGGGVHIDDHCAAELCLREVCNGLIIKPTIMTACGRGVAMFEAMDSNESLQIFAEYGLNFICQEKLKQHSEMEKLNPTSLNTLRVFTYRSLDKQIYFVEEGSVVRFGSAGHVFDNALAGGGFCAVYPDGSVSDRIYRDGTSTVLSLAKTKGLNGFNIPNFVAVKEFVRKLHDRLPYFDWVGWDVAIAENGDPVFIEFNVVGGCEAPQTAHGPIFGPHLDEVMLRIRDVKYHVSIEPRQIFPNHFERLDGIVTW